MSERLRSRTRSEPTTEYLKYVSPAWLGGLLDVGGTIGFSRIEDETSAFPYIDPRVKIVDHSRKRLYRLQKIAKGHVYNAHLPSLQWEVTGQKAINLVELAASFMPSRKAAVSAFQMWAAAGSTQDRVKIEEDYKQAERNNPLPSAAEYQFLIGHPEVLLPFTAGVIDCRGNFYTITSEQDQFNQLTVSSTNVTLLEVLKQQYAGGYHTNLEEGDTMQIIDHTATAGRNSYRWTVTKDMLANLLTTVGPYLQLLTPPSD